jgi:hypothetical protein
MDQRQANQRNNAGRRSAASVLPLPKGERRGEGEGTVHHSSAHKSPHHVRQPAVHGKADDSSPWVSLVETVTFLNNAFEKEI